MSNLGRFVWYELESNETDAEARFYTELIGWTLQEFPMGDFTYTMIANQGAPIGGFGSLPEPTEPARWVSWVYVDDLEDATRRARALGAEQQIDPTEIPPGRFAVILDPQGARITLFQQNDAPAPKPEGPPAHGSFAWTELVTPEPAKAAEFYTKLLGYRVAEAPSLSPDEPYRLLHVGEAPEAGILKEPSPWQGPPMWVPYIAVDDVDATNARVAELGGHHFTPPADVPEVGRFAMIGGPTGAPIAIMTFGG